MLGEMLGDWIKFVFAVMFLASIAVMFLASILDMITKLDRIATALEKINFPF